MHKLTITTVRPLIEGQLFTFLTQLYRHTPHFPLHALEPQPSSVFGYQHQLVLCVRTHGFSPAVTTDSLSRRHHQGKTAATSPRAV